MVLACHARNDDKRCSRSDQALGPSTPTAATAATATPVTVTIARGVQSRIRQYPDSIVIMVKEADDPKAATAGLAAAAAEIAHLDAGWTSVPNLSPLDANSPQYVSEVLPSAYGPFVMIDGGHVPYRVLRTIPDIVARHLEAAGVTEATIACPRDGGPLINLFSVELSKRPPLGVALHLYPPPPRRWNGRSLVPDGWLQEAAAWVATGMGDAKLVNVKVVTIEFPLPPSDVAAFLGQIRNVEGEALVISGELGRRMRGASGWFMAAEPALTMGAGGPGMTDTDLLSTFWKLVEVARQLAPEVGYAVVDFDPSADVVAVPGPRAAGWNLRIGEATIIDVCDEYLPDAYPYQVLGPSHLERLGGLPRGARWLDGGRVELVVGDPAGWLIDLPPQGLCYPKPDEPSPRRNPDVQERARLLLAPCFLRRRDLIRRQFERWAKYGGVPPGALAPPVYLLGDD